MNPVLSIIITIYNKENYITEALESVLNQSLKEIEIICVDDGSTDSSGVIVDEYAKKYPNIKVLHKKNEGQVSARKIGISSANAGYIGFVDADDWIDSVMFERLYNEMKSKDLDFVSSGIITHEGLQQFDTAEQRIYKTEQDRRKLFSTMIWDFNTKNNGVVPNTVTKLYKKEILKRTCKGIDTCIHYHEDDGFVYSYIVQCKTIGILHEAYYHYRYVENSDSNTKDDYFFARQNCFYLFLKNEFKKTAYYNILIHQLDYYVARTLVEGINFRAGLALDAHMSADFVFAGKKKIAVYGAGKHGREIIKQITDSENYELVMVIDRNLSIGEVNGYAIQKIENVKKIEFDRIVITIIDEKIHKEVYDTLLELGVPKEKIAILSI